MSHPPSKAETHEVPRIEHGVFRWVRYECEDEPTVPAHLVPTWDIRGHSLSPEGCPCAPVWNVEDNMHVHNAFDGRERYEYGHALRH